MIEWITEHWQSLVVWAVKQFRLSAENADLTKKLADAEDCAKASEASVAELKAQRDVLAECLEPPALDEGEINIIRFLAVRGIPIESYRLGGIFKVERTRFDHYINRLTGTFRFVQLRTYADTRPEVYELTESGKAYAVANKLC